MKGKMVLWQDNSVPRPLKALILVISLGTFFSEAKLIPGIRNNAGFFELFGFILIVYGIFVFHLQRYKLKAHPIIFIVGLWFVVALISLTQLPAERLHWTTKYLSLSSVQTIVFLFQCLLMLTLFNFLRQEKVFVFFLRSMVIALTIVGVWVMWDQFITGSYASAGPFRSRSHMGIYCLGGFWILLVYRFWPTITQRERWLVMPAIGMIFYAIMVSLRQSVYVAFIAGLLGLAVSFVFARGKDRFNISASFLLLVPFALWLYFFGSVYFPQLSLTQRELAGLDERLQEATVDDEDPGDASFDSGQRAGALAAFGDHPILGLGWLGFYESAYSPTGHELHSTPFRILAELGLMGFVPYLLYLVVLIGGVIRLFWRARPTPYQLSALVLMIGMFSVTMSHWYNRMFTDRPYWMLLVVFMVFEALMGEKRREAEEAGKARRAVFKASRQNRLPIPVAAMEDRG